MLVGARTCVIAQSRRARSHALCLDTVRLQVITHSCAWVSTCEPLVLWLASLHSAIRTVTQVFGDDYIFVPVHLHSGTIGVFRLFTYDVFRADA